MDKRKDFIENFECLKRIRAKYPIEELKGKYREIYMKKVEAVCCTASLYAKEKVLSCFCSIPVEKSDEMIKRTNKILRETEYSKTSYQLLINRLDVDEYDRFLVKIKNKLYIAYADIMGLMDVS